MADEPTGDLLTDNQEPAVAWKDNLPDDLKQGMDRFSEPTDLAKSYVELEKAMGSRVKIPTDESTEEEVSTFYKKLGRPDNPEGYELNVPEGMPVDEEFVKAMQKAAFNSGVPKAQFESIVKTYLDYVDGELHRSSEEGERVLKEKWGANYAPNLEIAKRGKQILGGEDFSKMLEASMLGNNPVMVMACYNVGMKIADDTFVKGRQETVKPDEFVPQYKDSPEMYATGDDEDSIKARKFFTNKGHKY